MVVLHKHKNKGVYPLPHTLTNSLIYYLYHIFKMAFSLLSTPYNSYIAPYVYLACVFFPTDSVKYGVRVVQVYIAVFYLYEYILYIYAFKLCTGVRCNACVTLQQRYFMLAFNFDTITLLKYGLLIIVVDIRKMLIIHYLLNL